MRETYATVLLDRKTKLLRKKTGNLSLVSKLDSGLTPKALFIRSLLRPMKMLLFSPIVSLLSIFCALCFGLTFLLFVTFPTVFEGQYGFSTSMSGLAYLGLGVGMMLGVMLFSVMSDKIMKKLTAKGDGEMKPEYRLPLMVYLTPVLPVGFFWYGWTAYYKVQWMAPIMGTFFIGVGSLFVIVSSWAWFLFRSFFPNRIETLVMEKVLTGEIQMPSQIYLVDAFGPFAASALAANTLLRSLFGTFLPLAGPKMYASLGLGWGNSLLGFLALAFAPVPLLFWKYGEVVRKRFPVKL